MLRGVYIFVSEYLLIDVCPMLTHTQSEIDVLMATDTDYLSQIVVYNDDHNTFDWVIECFMDILGHTAIQAEQLSLLIHFKGKASVKQAEIEILRPLKDALVDRGLSAVIEHKVT